MQTQSTCYKGTRTMTVLGVLFHSTGANNPNLKRYVQPSDNASDKAEMLKLLGTNSYHNDWNHISHQAGLNAWIGKLADGSVATVQTMPWNYRPWGCGSGSKGSCNTGWIQFEICEDGLNDASYFAKVYQEAVELTAYLCKLYNIDPNGTAKCGGVTVPTILCHADSHKLGLGSNHGDVLHWFPKYGKSMATVRADVAALLKGQTVETPAEPAQPVTDNEKAIWDFLYGKLGNAYGTAGLMGNLYAESALKSTNLQQTYEKKLGLSDAQYTAKVDDGSYINFVKDSAGYGLAQWTYWSRKQALYQFAKSAGKSIGDLQMQLDFLWKEIQGYTSVLNTLKTAKSVKAASDSVLTQYERPADQGDAVKAKRTGYGQTYYNKYVKAETPVQTTAYYRVRKSWADAKSQIGAYKVLANAKAAVDKNPGYAVFDQNGTQVYPVKAETFKPYTVRISITDLYIRSGPGTNNRVVQVCPPGVYTIVAESDGTGASKWGKLKSGVGWVSLEYTSRV